MDSPLHECIRMEDLAELRRLLLLKEFEIDALGSLMWTPLQEAINVANLDMVRVLLQNGANPLQQDSLTNNLPVDLAEEKHNSSEFDMLQIIDLLNSPEWSSNNNAVAKHVSNETTNEESEHKSTIIKSFKQNLANIEISFEYNIKKKTLKIRIWKVFNILFPAASICQIHSVYVRCHLRPDAKGKSKRNTKKVKLPERVASNAIASSTRPDTVCFDDVVVYESLDCPLQNLVLEIELLAVQWANGWLATSTKHILGSLKLDVDQAVCNLHREIYDLKPNRRQFPACLQCYYVDADARHAHRSLAPPPGTPPPAFLGHRRHAEDADEESGELTSVRVDNNIDNQSLAWDHEICMPFKTESHVVDLAAVHH